MPGPGTGKAFQYFLQDAGLADERWVEVSGGQLNDDDVPAGQVGFFVGATQYIWDERAARWVRERANRSGDVLLPSAARTVTTNSTLRTNRNWRGLHVVIDVTVFGGGLGIVPHIQGSAPNVSGGTFYDILIGTTIVATGVVVLKVYPGIAPVAGGAASDILVRDWRFQMEALDATSHTYVVEAEMVI